MSFRRFHSVCTRKSYNPLISWCWCCRPYSYFCISTHRIALFLWHVLDCLVGCQLLSLNKGKNPPRLIVQVLYGGMVISSWRVYLNRSDVNWRHNAGIILACWSEAPSWEIKRLCSMYREIVLFTVPPRSARRRCKWIVSLASGAQ